MAGGHGPKSVLTESATENKLPGGFSGNRIGEGEKAG